ncbi:hypothetical protein ACHHYP_05061 [Achlya hypogyna]|uniref:Uncharacterized protein n=1 Tax=Achlya hypogyna TaxID=1202772 RepID=A0A1V9YZ22_ACHHY|nr:hypothetical protein ACHHYP_05061 [Achlya hypogyna]
MEAPPRSVSPPHISRSRSSRSSLSSSSHGLFRSDSSSSDTKPRYMQETTSSIQKHSEEDSPPKVLCHPPGNPRRSSKVELRPADDVAFGSSSGSRRTSKGDLREEPSPGVRRGSSSTNVAKPEAQTTLEWRLEDMTLHYQRAQAMLYEKDAIIATFTQTCARLKADCEAFADKAASWKARYEEVCARHGEAPSSPPRAPTSNAQQAPPLDTQEESPSAELAQVILELSSIVLSDNESPETKPATQTYA